MNPFVELFSICATHPCPRSRADLLCFVPALPDGRCAKSKGSIIPAIAVGRPVGLKMYTQIAGFPRSHASETANKANAERRASKRWPSVGSRGQSTDPRAAVSSPRNGTQANESDNGHQLRKGWAGQGVAAAPHILINRWLILRASSHFTATTILRDPMKTQTHEHG